MENNVAYWITTESEDFGVSKDIYTGDSTNDVLKQAMDRGQVLEFVPVNVDKENFMTWVEEREHGNFTAVILEEFFFDDEGNYDTEKDISGGNFVDFVGSLIGNELLSMHDFVQDQLTQKEGT